MLFIAPLLSLALTALAADERTAVFYSKQGFQGNNYTVTVPTSTYCVRTEQTMGFTPNSAKLLWNIKCVLYSDYKCEHPSMVLLPGLDHVAVQPNMNSAHCWVHRWVKH